MPRKPVGVTADTENHAKEGHTFTEQFTTGITRDDLRRAFRSGRSYIWPPNGAKDEVKFYVSVTNALNSLPKEALPRWAAKSVAEHAVEHFQTLESMIGEGDDAGAVQWLKGAPWNQRDKAADVGSAVHLVCELDVAGRHDEADAVVAELDKGGQAKALQARHFFREVPIKWEWTEAVVYNDTYVYAGTLDFIGLMADEALLKVWPGWGEGPLRLIFDVKTGKGVYDETALQLSAYRYAEYIVELASATREKMPETHGGAVIHVTEDGWELIPCDTSRDAFRKFCRALALQVELPLTGMVGTPALRGKHV